MIITDRGRPAYVLMRHEAYRHLTGRGPSILDLVAEPGTDEIEFDPPRMGSGIFRPASLD
ncbi:MAG: hypothetical protein ACREF1_11200 [Acetobacteraceae bacterium]